MNKIAILVIWYGILTLLFISWKYIPTILKDFDNYLADKERKLKDKRGGKRA